MKKTLKALLIVAGTALATSVAQANTDTAILSGTGSSILVTSTVTDSPTGWHYVYVLTAISPGTIYIDSYATDGIYNQTGLFTSTPFGWTASKQPLVNNVSWILPSFDLTLYGKLSLTFDLKSPFPPVPGSAGANDGTGYVQTSGVVPVPGVTDGGLTVSLLGGGLLGLAALRRKLSI